MRSSILLLGLVVGEVAAGCGFHSPAAATDGSDGGGGGDSSGCTSFASLVDTCQLTFDADLMVMMRASYNTDTHVLMIGATATPVAFKTVTIDPDEVDVISAHNVQLAANMALTVTGSRGLAIIANNDVTIEAGAQIDVSRGGAGARTACPGGAQPGQDNINGASGGGGGGYGADGGNGGAGNHNGVESPGGSQGKAESPVTGFHGGCPGASGGTGNVSGGIGGKGGGALYIVAAGHIVLLDGASLNAGGDGGGGGQGGSGGDAGGGGGGSGGLLILESPHIMGTSATVTANGGSGGGGSSSQGAGTPGVPGPVNDMHAMGGPGAQTASDGGDGGSGSGPGRAGGSVTDNADSGGGGGGGSAGVIHIHSSDSHIQVISPAQTP